MSATAPRIPQARLPYDDADDAHAMATDASACRSETHLAKAADAVALARRTAEAVPGAVLQAPRALARTALTVTDAAARFAGRLFD